LARLYLLGGLTYGGAAALYAASVMQKLPGFWFGAAGGSFLVGAMIAAA
jgi:hypothetical protein